MLDSILDAFPSWGGASSKAAPQPSDPQPTGGLLGGLSSLGYKAAKAALTPLSGPAKSAFPGLEGLVRGLIAAGRRDENALTDELLYRQYPGLRGMKLKAGSQEAREWLRLRDEVVRPALAAAAREAAAKGDGKSGGASKEAAGGGGAAPQPSAPLGPVAPMGEHEAYYNQNDNSYDDGVSEWAGGSAGKNTCNMTALTMALVSMAGSEARAREAVIALLHKTGVRSGAAAKVGGKKIDLAKALKDPAKLADVQLEDLVIAAAVSITNDYDAVTKTGTILKVAKATGLVTGGKAYASTEKLYDPETLQRARDLLAAGQRVVVGTKNHYVYLVGVRDDGIVVHDPAGARVAVDSDKYIWPGAPSAKVGGWLGRLKDADRRETLVRRMATNPAARPAMEKVAQIAALKGAERSQALAELKEQFTGSVDTGASNYYSLADLKTYNARIRVVLEGQQAEDAGQTLASP